jgi:hypothetical protein
MTVPRGPAADLRVCWYSVAEHRPAVGWCPTRCSGPATHAERLHDGVQRLYCETHADWRRRTARVPLVRRMRRDEIPETPARPLQTAPATPAAS